jgi:hypothetical protein
MKEKNNAPNYTKYWLCRNERYLTSINTLFKLKLLLLLYELFNDIVK